MEKYQYFQNSVTENGNIQVRMVTEYKNDEGNVSDISMSDPFTPIRIPLDEKGHQKQPPQTFDSVGKPIPIISYENIGGFDLAGWDKKTKDVVDAITDYKVLSDFGEEIQEPTCIGIEEITRYDRILEEDGSISVRRKNYIFDEGIQISLKYHRSSLIPGQDTDGFDVISKALAKKTHTHDVIKKYKVMKAEQNAKWERDNQDLIPI